MPDRIPTFGADSPEVAQEVMDVHSQRPPLAWRATRSAVALWFRLFLIALVVLVLLSVTLGMVELFRLLIRQF